MCYYLYSNLSTNVYLTHFKGDFMFSRLPILGTKGYTIDLLSHEVFNHEGKKLKPFVDGRGRVSIKLVRDDGKRQVFIIKDIVKKLSPTQEKQKVVKAVSIDVKDLYDRIETFQGFLENMHEILEPENGIERYIIAKDLINNPDTELLKEILRVIARLPSNDIP